MLKIQQTMKKTNSTNSRTEKRKKRKSKSERPNYLLYWPYVIALVPFYDEQYNTLTRVMYIDCKTEEYQCRCEVILEQMAVQFYTSLKVVRGRAALLNVEPNGCELRKVPLVMIRDYSFVPVKCRRELVRNSGSLAYVAYQYMERIEPKPGNACEIVFKNQDLSLSVMQQYSGVEEQMKLARYLHYLKEIEEQYWQYEICNAKKAIKKFIQK